MPLQLSDVITTWVVGCAKSPGGKRNTPLRK